MNRIVIDLDGTLTVDDPAVPYADKKPDLAVVRKLHEYRALGFAITVHTARNMRSLDGNIGKINVQTLPLILEWLERHEVPFDEVIVGKPWCGPDGFYVDDRALRPDEFALLAPDEALKKLGRNRS